MSWSRKATENILLEHSGTIGVINNAPSTPNDSFHVDEDKEEDDDDCLIEWLVDEDTLVVDNTHVNFAALNASDPPPPAVTPMVYTFFSQTCEMLQYTNDDHNRLGYWQH
jgi:hypothetical protein